MRPRCCKLQAVPKPSRVRGKIAFNGPSPSPALQDHQRARLALSPTLSSRTLHCLELLASSLPPPSPVPSRSPCRLARPRSWPLSPPPFSIPRHLASPTISSTSRGPAFPRFRRLRRRLHVSFPIASMSHSPPPPCLIPHRLLHLLRTCDSLPSHPRTPQVPAACLTFTAAFTAAFALQRPRARSPASTSARVVPPWPAACPPNPRGAHANRF